MQMRPLLRLWKGQQRESQSNICVAVCISGCKMWCFCRGGSDCGSGWGEDMFTQMSESVFWVRPVDAGVCLFGCWGLPACPLRYRGRALMMSKKYILCVLLKYVPPVCDNAAALTLQAYWHFRNELFNYLCACVCVRLCWVFLTMASHKWWLFVKRC